MADIKNNVDNVVDAVLSCKLVQKSTIYGFQVGVFNMPNPKYRHRYFEKKSTIYGFQGNKKTNFVKITLAVPKMVAAARRLIEKGEVSVWHFKYFH